MKTCCVPLCVNKEGRRYTIPWDERIRDLWLSRINNTKILGLTDNHFLSNYRVCYKHFTATCFEFSGKLKKFAIPTLNLPSYDGEHHDCFSFPKKQETPEKYTAYKSLSNERTTLLDDFNGVLLVPQKCYLPPVKQIKLSNIISVKDTFAKTIAASGPSTNIRNTPEIIVPPLTSSKQKIKASRKKPLCTEARAFYNVNRCLKKTIACLKRRRASTRQRIKYLKHKQSLNCFLDEVNETTAKFILSQRMQRLKPRGRRFSLDDKIFALSLYKQSGKAYRYLSKFFCIPSKKTLSLVLNKIPFRCGINVQIFESLKNTASSLKLSNKYCILMFDEVSLSPGLQYNKKLQAVDGFVDQGGEERQAVFADHALLFMLKGINVKWKQPLCFSFCEHTTSASDLVKMLKDIIRQIRKAGLVLIATVCDQGSTNQAAINILLKDTNSYCLKRGIDNRYRGYLIDGEEIVHLYDFPHLLKGIRNSLVTKDLNFTDFDGTKKTASWSHIVALYETDKQNGIYSQCYKLTDEHVVPSKIKKMRVKNCSQVFSHSVGSAMFVAAEYSNNIATDSKLYISPKAKDTAALLLFFDKLFDSVNGGSLHPPQGKDLRCALSSNTNHINFWYRALPVLKSMAFSGPGLSNSSTPPSLKNWIFNIENFIYLWNSLKTKGFRHIAPRAFNQDPLENYFSCVRSHGVRNTSPTCSSFITTNKALLINNLVSAHSAGANCENDNCAGVLDNLKSFLKTAKNTPIKRAAAILPPVLPIQFSNTDVNNSDESTYADFINGYISGFVLKKIYAKSPCDICGKKTNANDDHPANKLINKRQHNSCKLYFPSVEFTDVFKNTTKLILQELPKIIICYNIENYLFDQVRKEYSANILNLFCSDHQATNVDKFISIIINVAIYNYINVINKILNGKDLRRAKFDELTKLAYAKYQKTIKKKSRL